MLPRNLKIVLKLYYDLASSCGKLIVAGYFTCKNWICAFFRIFQQRWLLNWLQGIILT